jgi:predicted RNA-binding protein associated with RNAse of E/G family
MTLDNSLRAGNITQSQFNKALKTLNQPFKGLKGKDYEQAIIRKSRNTSR